MVRIIVDILQLFIFVLIAYSILSWYPPMPGSPTTRRPSR